MARIATAIAAAASLLMSCSSPPATGPSETTGAPETTVAPAARPSETKAPETGEDFAALARGSLVGSRAPAADMEMLDGGRVALGDLLGQKPIYLKFWATWCVPCRKQMPHLEAAHRKYGDRIAVFAVDLGVNDSVEAVRSVQSSEGLTVPIAVDGDGSLAERFRVAVTPQHVLIDRAGIVRYVGHEANAELDRAIDRLLADRVAEGDPRGRAERPEDGPLSLTLDDGSRFSLAAHAGAPVVLTLTSAWCDSYLAKSRPAMSETCIAHTREIERLRRTHGTLVWVTILHPVWTSAASVEKYRARLGVSTRIGIDQTAAWFHRYRVRDLPTTIVLDGRGAEIVRVSGRGDGLAAALERLP